MKFQKKPLYDPDVMTLVLNILIVVGVALVFTFILVLPLLSYDSHNSKDKHDSSDDDTTAAIIAANITTTTAANTTVTAR